MLPKGKCICMLKRKLCVASFSFLTIVILFVFVLFSFTPALKALVSAKASFFFLKIRVKSSFSKYHAKIDIFIIAPLVSSNSSYIETVTIIS
jgi:hypothetical protein